MILSGGGGACDVKAEKVEAPMIRRSEAEHNFKVEVTRSC